MFKPFPVDEEINFDNNSNRIIRGIIRAEQGNWWHLMTEDGVEIIVNPSRVLFVKVFNRDNKITINNL